MSDADIILSSGKKGSKYACSNHYKRFLKYNFFSNACKTWVTSFENHISNDVDFHCNTIRTVWLLYTSPVTWYITCQCLTIYYCDHQETYVTPYKIQSWNDTQKSIRTGNLILQLLSTYVEYRVFLNTTHTHIYIYSLLTIVIIL